MLLATILKLFLISYTIYQTAIQLLYPNILPNLVLVLAGYQAVINLLAGVSFRPDFNIGIRHIHYCIDITLYCTHMNLVAYRGPGCIVHFTHECDERAH